MKHYLAFDLGASSGRAILGSVSEGQIALQEVHRFDNGAVDVDGGLYWNLLGLFAELKKGLAKALALGVDSLGDGGGYLGRGFRAARRARQVRRVPATLP